MREMNQPENRMSEAFRRLNALAPQGAPPALGEMLKAEFQRHHARRRRNRAVGFSLLAAGLAAAVALSILLLRPRAPITRARQELAQRTPQTQTSSAAVVAPAAPRSVAQKSRARVKGPKNPATDAERFVALPTFDPSIPIDHAQIVRLDLPGRALQLVGFPVNEEMAERRVVADVLLAQDGTPYALRLVRSSEDKEQ